MAALWCTCAHCQAGLPHGTRYADFVVVPVIPIDYEAQKMVDSLMPKMGKGKPMHFTWHFTLGHNLTVAGAMQAMFDRGCDNIGADQCGSYAWEPNVDGKSAL